MQYRYMKTGNLLYERMLRTAASIETGSGTQITLNEMHITAPAARTQIAGGRIRTTSVWLRGTGKFRELGEVNGGYQIASRRQVKKGARFYV